MRYDELISALRQVSEDWGAHDFAEEPSYVRAIIKEAADAIAELQAQIDGWIEQERNALLKSVPKWIPVTERLPLYGQDVLAVRTYWDGEKSQEVLMAHIAVWDEETGEKWWNATNITHWMPLPEPPKEET